MFRWVISLDNCAGSYSIHLPRHRVYPQDWITRVEGSKALLGRQVAFEITERDREDGLKWDKLGFYSGTK